MFSVNLLVAVSLSAAFLMLFSGCFLPYFLNAFAFSDINFAAVGDFGCPVSSTSNQWKTINNIKSRNAERVLGLGDYSYETVGNADCWINFMQASGLDLSRLKQTIGNHETDQSGKLADFVNAFKPYPPSTTTQYYSFNYQRETGGPKIHVLVMSTEQCWSTSCAQYKFVDNDLKTASQDPSIQWIIVDYHKVMYVSPNKCSSSSCVGSSSLRTAINPLLDKYGVDIVLQGHVHNYERSKLIKYSGGSSPTIVQGSTTTYTKSSLRSTGEIFATVGTGGVNFHGWAGKSSFIAFQKPSSDATFGILDLLVTNDGKTLVGKYINNGGSVKDQFTIAKTLTSSASKLSATSAPIAINQSVSTNENTAKPINLAARDKSNSSLQYSIVTGPSHGELAGKRPSIVYLPSANYTGSDQFTFKANNGRAESNLATINITVNKAGPTASASILENVSKALKENKQLKSLAEKGKTTLNQTEFARTLPDLTKPLIPERQAPSNQSQPLQVQPDLTKPSSPSKQTEPSVNTTESKTLILPKEKIQLQSRPIANAGEDQITRSNSLVSLDASKSTDKDGKVVSYLWSQVKGPKVLLNHPDKAKPSFQSPSLDTDTILTFRLVVKDDSGLVGSDTVGVKVLKGNEFLRQDNSTENVLPDNPSTENSIKMRNST